jgi:hypothetical protein
MIMNNTTQDANYQKALSQHAEAVLWSQGEGKDAQVTYAKNALFGPAIMIFISDTADGYRLDFRALEGRVGLTGCVGQLEITVDNELKTVTIKKPKP